MVFAIGLTGGIASGKTTVCEIFKKLAVPVIDADEIARQLSEIGEPVYYAIVKKFGEQFCLPDGQLNRRLLRTLIFSDAQAKHELEQIIHPAVRAVLLDAMAQVTEELCIVAVPLLIEADMQDLVDRILIIDIDRDIQLQRLCQRDKIDENLARQMINAQIGNESRLQYADDIINNSHNNAELEPQVRQLLNFYQQLVLSRR